MTDFTIGIPTDRLADIFPFHLAINQEWKLVQVGKVLQRIYPDIDIGSQFEQHFQIQHPATDLNFDSIQAHLQSLFIVKVQCSELLLKGQMVVSEPNVLLFLGTPWITDLNALAGSGLTLTDFAIHDPIVEYLGLLQTQQMALEDARKLADKLQQQQSDVRRALQQEKELNDLKSRFITTASHEFRTPLGIIASSAGIMQDYADVIDNAMRQKHLARIQAAVSRMTGLLDDVLTMSEVEAGTLKFAPHPVNLAAFCQDVVKGCQGKNSHILNYTISPDLIDQAVTLDQNLLNQLFTNLLSNAIKYTPASGTIVFDVRSQDNQIIFVVQDSGIGIPAEDLRSVFHPFHRASNVGNIAGTGLGLAIAKHCVDLHHGKIKVTSEVGSGTTITVILPLQTVANATDLSGETTAS